MYGKGREGGVCGEGGRVVCVRREREGGCRVVCTYGKGGWCV